MKKYISLFLFLFNCASEEEKPIVKPKPWCSNNCSGEYQVLIDDSFSVSNQKRIIEGTLAWTKEGADIKLSFNVAPKNELDYPLNHPGFIYVINEKPPHAYGWTTYFEDQALILVPDDSEYFDAVLIHEAGHAFHLGDDPAGDESSVMGAGLEITEKDMNNFCSLWRCSLWSN